MSQGPDDDALPLIDDAPDGGAEAADPVPPWAVLVADDDRAVHDVTELSLSGFRFAGRGIELLHAYSGAETVEVLSRRPDVALVLLDVVMERDSAGLDAVRSIRRDLGNTAVRIVLRTGQPGAAPERSVIVDYEIDHYSEKSELTSGRLFSLVVASLRGFDRVRALEANRRSLARMIAAYGDLFRLQSFESFTEAMLGQMHALLHLGTGTAYMSRPEGDARSAVLAMRPARSPVGAGVRIVAGTGDYAGSVGTPLEGVLPADALRQAAALIEAGGAGQVGDGYGLAYRSALGYDKFLYIGRYAPPGAFEADLLAMFSQNVGVAYDNIHLQDSIEATQREVAFRLGESIEFRSKETGNHVRRVGRVSRMLAAARGLPAADVDLIEAAAPLHDIGKVAIPDAILNKPGRLTPEERREMEEHTTIGHRILAGAETRILRCAAEIALSHHERWDGEGYPNRIAGEGIPLSARIVAVADVFDALGSERPYKAPWPPERIRAHFEELRGRQFDPALVDLLLRDFEAVLAVRAELPD